MTYSSLRILKTKNACGKVFSPVGQAIGTKVFSKSMYDFHDPFLHQEACTVMHLDQIWMTFLYLTNCFYDLRNQNLFLQLDEKKPHSFVSLKPSVMVIIPFLYDLRLYEFLSYKTGTRLLSLRYTS